MTFDYAELSRRIAALEDALPSSLRMGRVVSVSGGRARVVLADGDNMVTHELPTLQKRVLKDQDIKMPDVGEPVACLFSGQGREAGVILGAYYNNSEQPPGVPKTADYHRYADGTEIMYDRETHTLTAKVRGDVCIETEGSLTASAKQGVRFVSALKIRLEAPLIELAGRVRMTDKNGGPSSGEIVGDLVVREGMLTVPDSDVVAGTVALRGHVHENAGGNGLSGTPAP